MDLKDKRTFTMIEGLISGGAGIALDLFFPGIGFAATMLEGIGIACETFVLATMTKYNKIFKLVGLQTNRGIQPLLKKKERTNVGNKYHFTLPCGMCVNDFEKKEDVISQHLGKKIKISYDIDHKEIIIEEIDKDFMVSFDYEYMDLPGLLPIYCGRNIYGDIISFDIAVDEPHSLMGGETGSGKSSALRVIITNLILGNSNVLLHLVDLKGTEFGIFENCPHVSTISTSNEAADKIVKTLILEMNDRYAMFKKMHAKDITDYNKKYKKNKLPFQLLIVDEFADLCSFKKNSNNTFFDDLNLLGRKARSAGIFVFITSQRIDAKIIDGQIKANFSNVIALKTKDKINSRLVLDESGCEALKGKGNGYLKHGGDITEIQFPFLDYYEAEKLLDSVRIIPVKSVDTTIKEVKKKDNKKKSKKPISDIIDDMLNDDKSYKERNEGIEL